MYSNPRGRGTVRFAVVQLLVATNLKQVWENRFKLFLGS
nr:MAG TPA: hypothetical protein [Podoviridae sp. ctY3D12]